MPPKNTLWIHLCDLIPELAHDEKVKGIHIFGVTTDSRKVHEGYLFIDEGCAASKKHQKEAWFRGAAVVVLATEKASKHATYSYHTCADEQGTSRLIVHVHDMQVQKGRILHHFYHNPTHQLSVVGVTGTNGKTSVTSFVAQASRMAGQSSALLGSRGFGLDIDYLESTGYTTPPCEGTAYYAWKSLQLGAERLCMEVSSHAIATGRVSGVAFDTLVLTNVTRDHFDFHGGFDAYRDVKASLFYNTDAHHVVLNADDPVGRKIAREYAGSARLWAYTTENQSFGCSLEMLRAFDIETSMHGISMQVFFRNQQIRVESRWIGRFNVSNVLAGMTTLLSLGYAFCDLPALVAKVPCVPGRMQRVHAEGSDLCAILDYAHTPAALEAVLVSLQEVCERSLIVVFGCGGDRDKGKRELMGAVAEKYANQVILTSDNPRSEDPRKIIDDILKGMMTPWDVDIILSREDAIAEAIHRGHKGDIILVCGKGDEQMQEVAGVKHAFCDLKKIEYFLSLRDACAKA